MVTDLIPAHNEEASVPQAIPSLKSQSHRPDRLIDVADNRTDATIRLAHSRQMPRRRGRVFVLTGTASLLRPVALRAIADSRGRTIPRSSGDVYDAASQTGDNELTIAIKSLGGLMVPPQDCTMVTGLMPSCGPGGTSASAGSAAPSRTSLRTA